MTSLCEALLKLISPTAAEAAQRAKELTEAFAKDKSVKFTEAISCNGFIYGRVEPVAR